MVYVFLSVAGNYGKWAGNHLIDLHVTQLVGGEGSEFGNKLTKKCNDQT